MLIVSGRIKLAFEEYGVKNAEFEELIIYETPSPAILVGFCCFSTAMFSHHRC
jgi:hypothetical protein